MGQSLLILRILMKKKNLIQSTLDISNSEEVELEISRNGLKTKHSLDLLYLQLYFYITKRYSMNNYINNNQNNFYSLIIITTSGKIVFIISLFSVDN